MSLIELDTRVSDDLVWTAEGGISIVDTADYVAVAEHRKAARAFIAKVEQFFAPLKQKAQQAHKALCDSEKQHVAPAHTYIASCDIAMKAWDAAQEQKRLEERRRLEAQARKDEEARRIAEAVALEREAHATGDAALLAEAEELISAPVETPAVFVPPATPKVEGVSYREVWQYEVTDDAAIPRDYLVRDDKKLGAVVRAMKGATNIPGLRVFCTKTVVTR